MTWPEAVDQALCFGWIDGVRKSLGDVSYTIRFTPRRSGSIWSAINIRKVGALTKSGHMMPAGLEVFRGRSAKKSEIYSYERKSNPEFAKAEEAEFRANQQAWQFFMSQPAWYQRTATHLIISAKKEETMRKRFKELMEDSAQGRTIRSLVRKNK